MMDSSQWGAEAVSSEFQPYRILARAKGGARAPCAPPGYATGGVLSSCIKAVHNVTNDFSVEGVKKWIFLEVCRSIDEVLVLTFTAELIVYLCRSFKAHPGMVAVKCKFVVIHCSSISYDATQSSTVFR